MGKDATKRISKPVTRVTVVDAVTEQLRRLILSGAVSDGSPLRQDALAEEMGTSRIPVREALSRLESEGLVASFPHRGYVVTGLSRSEIQELYDLRCMLEPELIRLAIPKLTDAVFAEVDTLMVQFTHALGSDDMHAWGELNRRFHMALYAPSNRTRTLEIVRGLLINSERYTRVLLNLGKSFSRALEEHAALLDHCRKRQINQAVALTRDHIQANGDELLTLLDQRGFAV